MLTETATKEKPLFERGAMNETLHRIIDSGYSLHDEMETVLDVILKYIKFHPTFDREIDEDYRQEARIGIWKAGETYKSDIGTDIFWWTCRIVRQKLYEAQKEGFGSQIPFSKLDSGRLAKQKSVSHMKNEEFCVETLIPEEALYSDIFDISVTPEFFPNCARIARAMDLYLNDMQREMLKNRIKGYTLKEVGQFSREASRQVCDRSMKRLRKHLDAAKEIGGIVL